MTSGSSSTNGSSPRERGTDKETQELSQAPRFIPACAGNSWHGHLSHGCTPVHPRVRWEQRCGWSCGLPLHGSSPRARGTVAAGGRERRQRRFIPACAGNRWRWPCCRRQTSVHPRVRGEQSEEMTRGKSIAGSSPRARGTDRDAEGDVFGQRFIPACAGNSSQTKFTSSACPVHPRVRGEQAGRFSGVRPVAGSSPRARGTDGGWLHGVPRLRFIPACAGNRELRK